MLKLIFLSAWILSGSCRTASAELPQVPIEPNDQEEVYHQGESPIWDWLLAQERLAGFVVPSEGQTYKSEDYFSSVKDDGAVNDLVIFKLPGEQDEAGIGLVLDPEKSVVVTAISTNGSWVITEQIARDRVLGFLRPIRPLPDRQRPGGTLHEIRI
jgi:hypothetical protein